MTTPFAAVPALALALGLLGLLLTRRAVTPPLAGAVGAPRPRLALAALLVCAAAFAALAPAARMAVVHEGVVTDLLTARDCVEGPGCVLRYSLEGGSNAGIPHGALFTHLVAALRAAGLPGHPEALLWLAFAATALGAAATALLVGSVRRSAAAGLLAGGVFAAACVSGEGGANLSPPMLVPGAGALCTAAGCGWLLTRRRVFLVLAGAGAALAFQAHSSSLSLGAALAALVAASPRGARLHAASLMLASGSLVVLVVSPAQFMELEPHAPLTRGTDMNPVSWVPLGLAVLLGAASLAAPVAGAAGERPAIAFLLVHAVLALAMAASPRGTGRYLLPVLAGVSALVGIAAARLAAWLGPALRRRLGAKAARMRGALPTGPRLRAAGVALAVLATVGLVLWSTGHRGGGSAPLPQVDGTGAREVASTVRDAAAVAERLQADYGWGWEEALRHVRSAAVGAEVLLRGLSVALPREPARSAQAGGDLAILPWPPGRAPPAGWTPIDLPDAGRLLLRLQQPWLQWERFRVCAAHFEEPGTCRERTVSFDAGRPRSSPPPWWSQREARLPGWLDDRSACFAAVLAEIPVRPPAGAAERLLVVPGWSPFRIEKVEGLAVAGPLPASRVTLRAGGGEGGTITLGARSAAGSCFSATAYPLPPQVVELDPAEAPLVEGLDTANEAFARPAGRFLSDRFLAKDRPAPELRRAPAADEGVRPPPRLMRPLAPLWYAMTALAAALLALFGGLAFCAAHFVRAPPRTPAAEEPGSAGPAPVGPEGLSPAPASPPDGKGL